MRPLAFLTALALVVCLALFCAADAKAGCPGVRFVQDPVSGLLVPVQPGPAFRGGFSAGFSSGFGSPLSFAGAGFQFGLGFSPLGAGSFILNSGAGNISINENVGFGRGVGGRRVGRRNVVVRVR